MEEDNFDSDWLKERYPYDAEARNKSIEALALKYLKEQPSLTLVDVGAGTGSNGLYLMDKLQQDQSWIFIEQDASLKPALVKRLKEFAAFHKYEWEIREDKYFIQTPSKSLSFQIINDSLLNIATLIDVSKVDLFLANAVFDLLSATQLSAFLAAILKEKSACLFTMNYQKMTFMPEDPFDDSYIRLYNQHMERPQDFGRAMGQQSGQKIVALLEQANWQVTAEESVWRLLEDDIKMHYYLLNFMDNALSELDFDAQLKEQFPKWIQRKKDLVITRRQELAVAHLDIFATSD